MIKQIVVCDRCGKEIPEGKKIGYVAVYQRTEPMGAFIGENEFADMDFCEDCLCEITSFVAVKPRLPEIPVFAMGSIIPKGESTIVPEIGEICQANVHEKIDDAGKESEAKADVAAVVTENPKKPVKEDEVAPAPSKRVIDYGKIKALSQAG